MIVTGVAAVILGCHQEWGESSQIGGPSPPYLARIDCFMVGKECVKMLSCPVSGVGLESSSTAEPPDRHASCLKLRDVDID